MLYDKLKNHATDGAYPMHMPGHKRNPGFMPQGLPYEIDVTEIHGFDDLHDPHGILLETSELAAELYGSRGAFMLINGTTVGILAAIGAHTKRGDKILASSNSHWSIRNAAELFGLELVCITPETDETTGIPLALKADPEIKLVVITSPTYEGFVSDLRAISEIVHGFDIPLIVDSAHGAHLGFSDFFPENAVHTGADVVVMSLHKTLPALTQCSLLHVCGDRAETARIKHLLSILQTSSPSYVLMASIDHCLRLLKTDGERLFREYELKLKAFYESVKNLKLLSVTNPSVTRDPGKIVISVKHTSITGTALMELLRTKYGIELEKANKNYAIAMTSICDSKEGFTRLAAALTEIDKTLP